MPIWKALKACYFYTSQNGKALSLYNESEKIFDSYRKSAAYGGNIAVLDMLCAIARKDYTAAKKLLEHARSTWDLSLIHISEPTRPEP